VAIDATVGGPNSNSYITAADADSYFGERLHAEAWGAASEADHEKALLQACRHLERCHYWPEGGPAYTSPPQRLTFPRKWDVDADGDFAIPQPVKDAQCEEALHLLARGAEQERRRALQAGGVISLSVDGLSESYTPGAAHHGLFSSEARALLSGYLCPGGIIANSDNPDGEWSPGSSV